MEIETHTVQDKLQSAQPNQTKVDVSKDGKSINEKAPKKLKTLEKVRKKYEKKKKKKKTKSTAKKYIPKKNLYHNDIIGIMDVMGFEIALPETIRTVEDLLMNYMIDVLNESIRLSQLRGRLKIKFDDIKTALRNDPVRLYRADYMQRGWNKFHENKKLFESGKTSNKTNLKNIAEAYEDKDDRGNNRRGRKYKTRRKATAGSDESEEEESDGHEDRRKKKANDGDEFFGYVEDPDDDFDDEDLS